MLRPPLCTLHNERRSEQRLEGKNYRLCYGRIIGQNKKLMFNREAEKRSLAINGPKKKKNEHTVLRVQSIARLGQSVRVWARVRAIAHLSWHGLYIAP